jgi:multidrug efflux pump subunit AcrB
MATAKRISTLLNDRTLFPEVTSHITYVADGGPRFILGLNPPAPTLNRAYAVINLTKDADLGRNHRAAGPHAEGPLPGGTQRYQALLPRRGGNGRGSVPLHRTGPRVLLDAARKLARAGGNDGMARVRSNMEQPLMRLTVSIDQAKVAAAGLSNAAIYGAVNAIQDGTPATIIRDGDTDIPVVVRGDQGDRATIERLASLPVGPPETGVSLGSVATIRIADQPSLLARRNLLPMWK